jgi:hypothetical protein
MRTFGAMAVVFVLLCPWAAAQRPGPFHPPGMRPGIANRRPYLIGGPIRRPLRARALRRHIILRRLGRVLHLTPQQREAIRKHLQTARAERRNIRNNAKLTPAQKREQLVALRAQVRRAILDTLTPEQKARLHAIRRRIALRSHRQRF